MSDNLMMIMCHKNPEQVVRLAKSLLSDKTDVVIHIDLSMSENDYNILRNEVKDIKNIFITDKRIHGELDRRSLVDIVFIMINHMKQTGIKYKYYCLLSGQDYPIKPIEYITEQLEKSYPEPFIDCTPYSKDNWIYHKFNSTPAIISYNRYIDTLKQNNPLRKLLRLTAIIVRKSAELLRCDSYSILTKKGIELFGGSAWWILPDTVIDYISKEYTENTEAVSLLLNTHTPEETFFQIMTMRSTEKDRVVFNYTPTDQLCKTWAYFADEGKPFKGHPYTFTENEFEKIKQSDCFFARKFDIKESGKIFDLIDEYIENNN